MSSPWRQDALYGPQRLLPKQKLSGAQRDALRARREAGEDPRALALEFGVSASYVRHM